MLCTRHSFRFFYFLQFPLCFEVVSLSVVGKGTGAQEGESPCRRTHSRRSRDTFQILSWCLPNLYGSYVGGFRCAFAGARRGGVTLARSESKKLFAQISWSKNYRLPQPIGASEPPSLRPQPTHTPLSYREGNQVQGGNPAEHLALPPNPVSSYLCHQISPRGWGKEVVGRQPLSLFLLEQENSACSVGQCSCFAFQGTGAFSLEFPCSPFRQSSSLFTFRTQYKAVRFVGETHTSWTCLSSFSTLLVKTHSVLNHNTKRLGLIVMFILVHLPEELMCVFTSLTNTFT